MNTVTLLTDFGLKDGYAGVMKGVIWKIAPDVQIADITHLISPQNVMEGAIALGRVASYFPDGTVHIGVVDPGVGTQRRPIAARIGRQFYVVPDNGLISMVLAQAQANGESGEFVHLDNPKYWLKEVSNVFHGRDIFSPVGAHLASGVSLREVGTPITDPVLLELPRPQRIAGGWRGQVISIDVFGNLATNLMREHLADLGPVKVRVAGTEIDGLVRTFGERPEGELVALYGTRNDLLVSVVNGSARERLEAGVGDVIEVTAAEGS